MIIVGYEGGLVAVRMVFFHELFRELHVLVGIFGVCFDECVFKGNIVIQGVLLHGNRFGDLFVWALSSRKEEHRRR